MKTVLSVNDISELLGVSTDTVYTMVREKQIPHIRVRRRILFYMESIVEWLKNNSSSSDYG
ncbi:helix-turn-helix domain-containing protein [Cohnella pontilimi]